MKLSIIIFISSSPIRLNIIVYLVNNLCTKVLLEMNTLTREEANIDLKRKKLTVDYKKTDLVFKTLSNSINMHITTCFTMHEILCQRRLNYTTFTHQFQVTTFSSKLQTKSSLKSALFSC